MEEYACLYRCNDVFAKTTEADRPVSAAIVLQTGSNDSQITVAAKLAQKARDRHTKMYALASMASMNCDSEIVAQSCMMAYPKGDSSVLYSLMENKYKPQDNMASVSQFDNLLVVKMANKQDPLVLQQQFSKAQACNMAKMLDKDIKVMLVIS